MKTTLLTLIFCLASLITLSQAYTNTKQLRFFTITTASDTAATVANSGRMWYDFVTDEFRVNIDGTNISLVSGTTGGGPFTINSQTTSYQPVLSDANTVLITMNAAGANNLTIPANATTAFPTGSTITFVPIGTGTTTVVAAGGVTINTSSGVMTSNGQYNPLMLVKTGTDEWELWNGGRNTFWNVSGTTTLTGAVTIAQAGFGTTFSGNGKVTFSPTASGAGINFGSLAGAAPTLANGDMYYNSTLNLYTGRVAGTNASAVFIFGAGSSTGQVPFASSTTNVMSGDAGFTFSSTNDVLTTGRLVTLSTTTTPGIGVGSFAGDPSSLTNGDMWYNSSTQQLKARINSTSVALGVIQKTTVTITSGQLNALLGTPVTVLAAPGAGLYNDIISISVSYDYTGTAYTFANPVRIDYQQPGGQSPTTGGYKVNTTLLNGTADFNSKCIQDTSSDIGMQLPTNTAMQIYTTVANSTTTGTGDLNITIYYTVESIN